MKLLANENFPLPSFYFIQNSGLEIESITLLSPGISDLEVLEKAVVDNQIILTFDRDYGELIYKNQLPKPLGIVFFRLQPVNPLEVGEIFLDLIRNTDIHLSGMFTTIERNKIRQRPI
jgi:predicted nuclease of predicted toxin-antitoxin system